jgi:hypothetical protein
MRIAIHYIIAIVSESTYRTYITYTIIGADKRIRILNNYTFYFFLYYIGTISLVHNSEIHDFIKDITPLSLSQSFSSLY